MAYGYSYCRNSHWNFHQILWSWWKIFWGDEVVTLLYTAGSTRAELTNDITGREIEVGYLNKFIFTNPDKGMLDTIKSISIDETQHPPLYYVLSSMWLRVFGNFIWVIRSFSAVMGILSIPAYSGCHASFLSLRKQPGLLLLF